MEKLKYNIVTCEYNVNFSNAPYPAYMYYFQTRKADRDDFRYKLSREATEVHVFVFA